MTETELPHGSVGVFWGIVGSDGLTLLTEMTGLRDAEVYGDCLTHPRSHFEAWEQWKWEPSLVPVQLLIGRVASSEYEEHPRGRVVFSLVERTFWIYADRRLVDPRTVAQIADCFGIREGEFTVRLDSHYR